MQIIAALIRSAAENESAFLGICQIWIQRIAAHIGRERHTIGTIAIESFFGVVLGRRTNIAALGIKDDRNAGMIGMNVGDDTVQRVFRAFGCEVGYLGLKGSDKVCCCINDAGTKGIDGIGFAG